MKPTHQHGTVVRKPGVRGGAPTMGPTRLCPDDLWTWFAAGTTTAKLLREYPALTRADIAMSRALWRDAKSHFLAMGWKRPRKKRGSP